MVVNSLGKNYLDYIGIICLNTSMHKASAAHLRRLLCAHGSFAEVARRLGIQPRGFRNQRNDAMTKAIRVSLASASHALFLRSLLQELLRSGAVSREDVHAASAAIRARLGDPGRVHKRALRNLGEG